MADGYYRFKGIAWTKPRYQRVTKATLLPIDEEVSTLIAGLTKNVGAFTQLIRETGAGRREAYNIKWTDIDLQNHLVSITPEKGSNPRIVKISSYLAGPLGTLPKDRLTVWGMSSLPNFARP